MNLLTSKFGEFRPESRIYAVLNHLGCQVYVPIEHHESLRYRMDMFINNHSSAYKMTQALKANHRILAVTKHLWCMSVDTISNCTQITVRAPCASLASFTPSSHTYSSDSQPYETEHIVIVVKEVCRGHYPSSPSGHQQVGSLTHLTSRSAHCAADGRPRYRESHMKVAIRYRSRSLRRAAARTGSVREPPGYTEHAAGVKS